MAWSLSLEGSTKYRIYEACAVVGLSKSVYSQKHMFESVYLHVWTYVWGGGQGYGDVRAAGGEFYKLTGMSTSKYSVTYKYIGKKKTIDR